MDSRFCISKFGLAAIEEGNLTRQRGMYMLDLRWLLPSLTRRVAMNPLWAIGPMYDLVLH